MAQKREVLVPYMAIRRSDAAEFMAVWIKH